MANYMKLPFTLESPEGGWVTESKSILYDGDDSGKSLTEVIEDIKEGGNSSLPLEAPDNAKLSIRSNAETNYLPLVNDGVKNSVMLGVGGWAAGDRVFSINNGLYSLTITTDGNNLKVTRIQQLYVFSLQDTLTDDNFKTFVESIKCRVGSSGEYNITLSYVGLTKGTSNTDSYITVKPSVTIPTGTTSLSYQCKLTQRSISIGQSNLNAQNTADTIIGVNNTDLTSGNYNTIIGLYNIKANTNANGSNTIIGRNNILTGTTAPAYVIGYNNQKNGAGYTFGSKNNSGDNSIVVGQNNDVGNSVLNFGYGNKSADNNYIFGGNNTLDGSQNYIYGFNNKVNENAQINDVYGSNNKVSTNSTLVIGNNNTPSKDSQIVIGKGITATDTYDTIIGKDNNTIGINGDGVYFKDKEIALKEDVELPLETPSNAPQSVASKTVNNLQPIFNDGATNSVILGSGGWVGGNRSFLFNFGTYTTTIEHINGEVRLTNMVGFNDKIKPFFEQSENIVKKLVENTIHRENTSTGDFDITLQYIRTVLDDSKYPNGYIVVNPSRNIATTVSKLTTYYKQSGYSAAIGISNTITNDRLFDISLGVGNTNINSRSQAGLLLGQFNKFDEDLDGSNYHCGIAIGRDNYINNGKEIAIGNDNKLTCANTIAVGEENTVDATAIKDGVKYISKAFAFGFNNDVKGAGVALGMGNTVGKSEVGNYTAALGNYNNITGERSVGIGYNLTDGNNRQIVLGVDYTAPSDYKFIYGDTKPLFGVKDDGAYYDEKKLAYAEDVEKIELYKTPNITLIGTPTLQNGQISDFSETDFAQFPFLVDVKNKPFEINMCFTTPSAGLDGQQNIIDSVFGLAFAIRANKFIVAASSNGTTWNMGEHNGQMRVEQNTTYYAKFSWDGLQYKLDISTDKVTYTNDIVFSSTEGLFKTKITVGKSLDNFYIFGGSINLNYCNVIVDGSHIWDGMDDAGLATRLATDLSNIDEDGKKNLKAIVSEMFQWDEESKTLNIITEVVG